MKNGHALYVIVNLIHRKKQEIVLIFFGGERSLLPSDAVGILVWMR